MALTMSPYLVMDGNAREAVAFYEKALDAKNMGVMTFGDSPADPNHPTPEGAKERVMHAHLKIGDADLMLSDTFPGMPYQTGNHVTIAISTHDAAQARQIFDALAEGGQVTMPLQKTFWSPAYGQLADKYGVVWQISTAADA